MNELIIYLLKVVAIHGILFLFYRLVLRSTTKHSLNRGYLLGAFILAFIIPGLDLTFPQEKTVFSPETPIIQWLTEPSQTLEQFELVPVHDNHSFSWWSLIPWLVGLISLVLLIRSIAYLFVLHKLKKQSDLIRKGWFTLYKTSEDRPFSFFNNVFMPQNLFGSNDFKQVLAHECVHVQQFHSGDRLLLDFVVSLFWFNPFIYLYRSALIEIHEYQADEAVVRRYNDPVGYQEVLFSQLQSPRYSGWVSHFNVEMIKKRIVMMNKPKKKTGWVYAFAVPMMLMIVFAFSSREAMQPLNDMGNGILSLIGSEDDFATPGVEETKPSILPLRKSDAMKFTSGFGSRKHPIELVHKFHKGVDFSCPIGTEILATANGVVAKVEELPNGYGKLLTLSHGEKYQSRYAQLSEFRVEKGERVTKGQVIALSGNSGASTGPHLHYEVLKEGKHVDPMTYIKNFKVKAK